MTLQEYVASSQMRPADLARDMERSPSYVCHVIAGRKPLSRRAAITLYRKRGVKVDPISDATDEEISVLERFQSEAA